jgi:hypothetical protein
MVAKTYTQPIEVQGQRVEILPRFENTVWNCATAMYFWSTKTLSLWQNKILDGIGRKADTI